MRAGSLVERWGGLAERVSGMWQSLRAWRHTMRFDDLRDLVRDDDGSLVSTGFHPRAELISDRARPPRQWCWVAFTASDGDERADLPHLLVRQHGSAVTERFLLGPISRSAPPSLLRMPDLVSSIQLVPGNQPGRTNLHGVHIKETGKLRLFASLVLENPWAAWRIQRATPSFAHFKTKLIEARQRRQLPMDGPHWLRVYTSGTHPLAISYDGRITILIVLNAVGSRASHLDDAITSVAAQTYSRWRLMVSSPVNAACTDVVRKRMSETSAISQYDMITRATLSAHIESDRADYILFMDADTILEPHALARFAAAAISEDADMLYGDGIRVGEDGVGYVALNALPVFSHDSYLRSPTQFGPIVLRGSLALLTGGPDTSASMRETEVILRALEHRLRIAHIPDILSRKRAPHSKAWQDRAAEGAALRTAHLRRSGYPEAEVRPTSTLDVFAVRRHARHGGRILAIVPTKNRRELLETCIASLRATTRNAQVDIVVVDHDSTDADTLAYLDRVSITGVQVLRYHGPFNYSALNNAAITRLGKGYSFYLFLNNDIEAEKEGWLDAMLDLALQPDVGAVGATLLYPDRRIQHAGVVVGMVGAAEHAYRFARLDDYLDLVEGPHLTREYSAVTGACMLVSSVAFSSVGGFDEQLAVGFNDVDLCLRIGAKGFRVLQCAEAVLIHHESASRGRSHDGRDLHPDDTRLFYARHARILAEGDPFFSPLLNTNDALFVPQTAILRGNDVRLRITQHRIPTRVTRQSR